jgi:hypothetical protein
MWTAIDGPANIVCMIMGIAGRAVYASSAAASLAVRTKQDAPGMRPRTAFDQSPTTTQRVVDCRADFLVGMVVHAVSIRQIPARFYYACAPAFRQFTRCWPAYLRLQPL